MRKLSGAALAACACLALAAPARAQSEKDAELTFNAALTHLREGRLDMALEALKRAIRQDSKNPYFQKGLGVVYSQLASRCPQPDEKCRQGYLGEAVASARKALELNPYYVDARSDLGTYLLLSGKREEGKKEVLASFEDPTNPTPEHSARNLGQAYFEEKNYVQAQSWFQTAIQRNKSYPDAYLSLADALVAQNKVAEAITALEAGAKAMPDDASLMVGLGEALVRAGRLSEARARLEQAASKDAGGPSGRRALQLLQGIPR